WRASSVVHESVSTLRPAAGLAAPGLHWQSRLRHALPHRRRMHFREPWLPARQKTRSALAPCASPRPFAVLLSLVIQPAPRSPSPRRVLRVCPSEPAHDRCSGRLGPFFEAALRGSESIFSRTAGPPLW